MRNLLILAVVVAIGSGCRPAKTTAVNVGNGGEIPSVVTQFDHKSPVNSLDWYIHRYERAPYPLAEQTGNNARDKSMADYDLEWKNAITKKPLTWPMEVKKVTWKKRIELQPLAQGKTTLLLKRIDNSPAPLVDEFPLKNEADAAKLSAGSAVIFTGKVTKIQETKTELIFYFETAEITLP